jgi:hypothetical protein
MPNDTVGKGSIRGKSDDGLAAEWHYWNDKIATATGWGAALAAADEFRASCQREINRRGIKVAGYNT